MSPSSSLVNFDSNELSPEMFSDLLKREDWKPESIDDIQIQQLQYCSDVAMIPLPGENNGLMAGLSNGIIVGPGNIYNLNDQNINSVSSVNMPFQSNGAMSNTLEINNMTPSDGYNHHNGFQPHLVNVNNGHINPFPNGQYIKTQGWVPNVAIKKPLGAKKQKRNRTAFTSSQMLELEQEYFKSRYLDRNRRNEMSDMLNLNERTIKIWFQNRRMKEKKDRAESLEDSTEISTPQSSPNLSAESVPMFMTVENGMYNGGMYTEHYPLTSTPTNVPVNMSYMQSLNPNTPLHTVTPQKQTLIPNNFVAYQPQETFNEQNRQVHLQVQHFVPMPQPESRENLNVDPVVNYEQNWDFSWLSSLHQGGDV